MKLPVYNKEAKEVEKMDVPEGLDKGINQDVIYQATVMYQASLRQGTASTKTMGEVSGGGKKPWRQKGTGRARVGSIRSPLWSGGGVVFGPHPRDFGYSIPKKIKIAALRECLKVKFQNKNLFCLEDIKQSFTKTKEFIKILSTLKLEGKTLAMLDGCDPSIERASRNIGFLTLRRSKDVNAYDILRNKNILVSKSAFVQLLARIEENVKGLKKN